jgi:hypothetical protein
MTDHLLLFVNSSLLSVSMTLFVFHIACPYLHTLITCSWLDAAPSFLSPIVLVLFSGFLFIPLHIPPQLSQTYTFVV